MTCFRLLAAVLWLSPALAMSAEGNERFEKMKKDAAALSGVGTFLDKYVGSDCGSAAVGGSECLKVSAEFRREATGKKFFMIVSDDQTSVLTMGRSSGNSYTMNLTPFFPGSNSAITHGSPSRADAAGNPVLPFITIDGIVPELESPATAARWITTRAVRLEVIFTPQGTWTLPRKGGGKNTGVKARLEAVRVVVARSGEVLGVWFNR
ncbi:MAG: hypothetical protein K1X64_17625 [Myxococcaceae bacterium]|nr:hypothetical protein [Myxococcaceae bacterium]